MRNKKTLNYCTKCDEIVRKSSYLRVKKAKLRNTILYYFLICLGFIGCTEKDPFVSEDKSKLLVECVLTPGKEIQAKISTTNDFNNTFPIDHPSETVLHLRIVELPELDSKFEYDERLKLYRLKNYQINPKFTYRLEIFRNSVEEYDYIKSVEARTKIPAVRKIALEKSVIISKEADNGGTAYDLKCQFKAPKADINGNFFRAKPYLKNSTSQHLTPLDFQYCEEEALAFSKDKVDGMFYFDADRFENGDFTIYLRDKENSIEEINNSRLFFEIENITESVYRYNVMKIKAFAAEQDGLANSVINYTNCKDGYGILGGSQISLDSFDLKL